MADTSDFRNGLIIKFKNDLYSIAEFQHVKPGKGGAFVRSTLRNLRTGRVLENTFRAGEKVETVRVERRKYQYLYSEGDSLVCMDNETYEQINISKELISEGIKFLKESEEVEVLLNGSDIISVEIPIFINLKVIKTEPGFKGDTATGAVKPAKLETGAKINVPLFINEGDILKVDTRTGGIFRKSKILNQRLKMDLDLIKKLVKIVDSSGVTDLEIEENGIKVKIAKKVRSTQIVSQSPVTITSAQPVIQPASSALGETAKQKVESEQTSTNMHEIRSPIVGTFYRAPAPDADSYVQVGAVVSTGSVLCIVEAMKLMNEIESDVSGKIVKILVENGKPVEYNQPLFLIELA